jgi:predicted GIY-YIG superfamily endonuclease
MFTVYALYSPSFNQIYTGYTSDLPNRFLSHNELATKGHTSIHYCLYIAIKVRTFAARLYLQKATRWGWLFLFSDILLICGAVITPTTG